MADSILCPQCQAALRIPPAAAAGKRLRCPQCQAAVVLPPPPPPKAMTAELLPLPSPLKPQLVEDTSDAAPLEVAEAAPALRPEVALDPKKRKKKRKKKGLFGWLPLIVLGDSAKWTVLLACVALLGCCGIGGALWWGIHAWDPPAIPEKLWETVEVPGRFRAKLPGPSEKKTTWRLGGVPMEVHISEPNRDSIYIVGCSKDVLPADKLSRPPNKLLDELANTTLGGLGGRGWKEARRDPAPPGLFEGLQLGITVNQPNVPVPERRYPAGYLTHDPQGALDLPQMLWPSGGSGRIILRFYLAHGRLVVVLAAGRNFQARQENVQRLFNSLELLEPGAEPPAPPPKAAPPKPEPKPTLPPGFVADYQLDLGAKVAIARLRFSPDGRTLTLATDSGSTAWFSTESKTVLIHRKPPKSLSPIQLAFAPDAGRVAVIPEIGPVVRFDRDAVDEFALAPETGARRMPNAAAFSPDGKRLCNGYEDKTARVWDAKEGKLLREVGGHKGPVRLIAFSPDGKLFATVDDDLCLWDSESFDSLATVSVKGAEALVDLAFDRSGKWVAVASQNHVKVCSLSRSAEGELVLGTPRTIPYDGVIREIGFAADSRLVVLMNLGSFRVSNPADGKLLARGTAGITVEPRHTFALALHPTAPFMAIACGGHIRVFNLDQLPPR